MPSRRTLLIWFVPICLAAKNNLRSLFGSWKCLGTPTNQEVPIPKRPIPRPKQIQIVQQTPPRVQSPFCQFCQSCPLLLALVPPITLPPKSRACRRLDFSNETLPRVTQAERSPPQIANNNNIPPRKEASPISHQTRSRTGPLALFTEGNQ